MELVNPLAESYAAKYSSGETPLLRELAAWTRQNHPEQHMLSGTVQGRFLSLVSHMLRPARILEIGTFTGYSALCLAEGLAPEGLLHTIELREADATVARSFFDRADKGRQILLHTGNALDILPGLEETWDLVFIDADKPAYIDYFNLVFPRLRQNGFILADNVLFHGQVLQETIKGKSARGIQAFNDFIRTYPGIETTLLTIRDGLYLIRKS